MHTYITRIRSLIQQYKHVQFYCMLTFTEEGCSIHRFSYNTTSEKITESRSFFLKNVHEKNFSENKILRTIVRIIYFPFSYHLLLNVPHHACQTRLETVRVKREKPTLGLRVQELNAFFTHTVWKLVEKNKKLFIARHKYDEVNVLLAQNSLIKAFVGSKEILAQSEDSLDEYSGTNMSVRIVQSYLYRPIFTALARIVPKRARILSVLENGFGIAYNVGMKHTTKPALVCIVERNYTHLFIASQDEVSHVGGFHFGTHTVYEACNNALGIGIESYESILDRCITKTLSSHAKTYIEKIITAEISHLEKGILSFKKEHAITQVYVDAGSLNHFISLQKKFPARIIQHSQKDMHTHTDAAVTYGLSLQKNTYIRHLMQKLFRWLMPYSIE